MKDCFDLYRSEQILQNFIKKRNLAMKHRPHANQNKSDVEKDSFQKSFVIHQREIRKYITQLHHYQMGYQMSYIRKKFHMIEKTLEQEIKKALDTQFHMFQQKSLFHKLKAFFSPMIGQIYTVLNFKILHFWRVPFSFSFGYEELITFIVFLMTIGLIVMSELLSFSLQYPQFSESPQFLMTFY
ncbi:MAG: hypothetical protein K2X02_05860 [Alphaproteobacteria bacterium]|nr:hypothetical protein [Alphaproteobacteria bacterium]